MMTKTLFVPLMHISVSRLPVAYAKHPASVSLTLNIRAPELHMAGIKLGPSMVLDMERIYSV